MVQQRLNDAINFSTINDLVHRVDPRITSNENVRELRIALVIVGSNTAKGFSQIKGISARIIRAWWISRLLTDEMIIYASFGLRKSK